MRIGLIAFAFQGLVIAFATSSEHIFLSVIFSMITNLVYPSVSALVSRVVTEDEQGEALGALNGIKAVTEGFGPLMFGSIMKIFESTDFPGIPYLITSGLVIWAFMHSLEMPSDPDSVVAKYSTNINKFGQDDEEGISLLSASNGSSSNVDKIGID